MLNEHVDKDKVRVRVRVRVRVTVGPNSSRILLVASAASSKMSASRDPNIAWYGIS